MLCCAGLFAGLVAGAATGIPWLPFVAASLGAGGGFIADIKIFRALEEKRESKEHSIKQQFRSILKINRKDMTAQHTQSD